MEQVPDELQRRAIGCLASSCGSAGARARTSMSMSIALVCTWNRDTGSASRSIAWSGGPSAGRTLTRYASAWSLPLRLESADRNRAWSTTRSPWAFGIGALPRWSGWCRRRWDDRARRTSATLFGR